MASTYAEQLQRWQHFENTLNCLEQVITHECSSEDDIELSTQVQQAVRVAIQYAPGPLPPCAPKTLRADNQTKRSSTFPRRIRVTPDVRDRQTSDKSIA